MFAPSFRPPVDPRLPQETVQDRRSKRFIELLSDPVTVRGLGDMWIAFGRQQHDAVAAEFARSGEVGLRILEAALLSRGYLHAPAFRALRDAADGGDRSAYRVLRTSSGTRAIYPGTFDPFTLGHRDVAIRAAGLFDEVIIAVGQNAAKSPTFTDRERVALIERDLRGAKGCFHIISFAGSTPQLASDWDATAIIRGVRGITDLPQEEELSDVYRRQSTGQNLDTIFIPTQVELMHTSSSIARALAALRGGDASAYLSAHIADALALKVHTGFLRQRWGESFGVGSESESCFNELLAAYTADDRHYHNIHHIFEMVKLLDELKAEDFTLRSVPQRELLAAIFFHDVVYDPTRKDNELRSAEVAHAHLAKLGWSEGERQQVGRLIMLTAGHVLPPNSSTIEALMVDLDLAILGAEPQRYLEYSDSIRKEYKHISPDAYVARRPGVLGGFLARSPLYNLEAMQFRCERRARANMEAEIINLTAHS